MNYPKIFGNLGQNDVKKLEDALESLFNNFSSINDFNNFLSNVNIDKYLIKRLPQEGSTVQFTNVLVNQFIFYKVNSTRPEYHPLINLSKSLEGQPQKYNLSDEEIHVFVSFKERIENYFSSEIYQRNNTITNLIKRQKEEQTNISTTISSNNSATIDKSIILNHNLPDLEDTLKRTLGFRGVFAFNVSGDATIIEEYIIQRILLEYKKKKKHNQLAAYRKLIKIRLYNHSICQESNTIEQELRKWNICNNLLDLVHTINKSDTIIIIWNYDLERNKIKTIASEFLTAIKTECSDLLKDNNQCLLVILANIFCQVNIDGFVSLKTPKKFILEGDNGLLEWFNYELNQLTDLQSDDVKQYLKRIKHHNGHLIGTYQEIKEIVGELNERYH